MALLTIESAFGETDIRSGWDVRENVELSSLTTFRIGGRAAFTAAPWTVEDFCRLVAHLENRGIRYDVLGGGSNVLAPDEGYNGVLILTERLNRKYIEGDVLVAQAGVRLSEAVSLAVDSGLGGMEALFGIPGSVGGAVYMNAGAFGVCISDLLLYADCYDKKRGEIRRFSKEALAFGYRKSLLQDKSLVVISAAFSLTAKDKEQMREAMRDIACRRRSTQPLEYPSAGSVFKRPGEQAYAGKLIDECGLKGLTVGGAQVSQKHAGFIVNINGARASDVRCLIDEVKRTVKEKTGYCLECEVEFLGEAAETK